MRLLIMGKPGAGKGTQAALIIQEFGIPHISTGDMFRAAIQNKTALGLKAQAYIAKGLLVPDEVTIGLVAERLAAPDCREGGFLLDGFPRNIKQAEALEAILERLGQPLDLVLDITVDNKVLIDRITGRRICRNCGATYHIATLPAKKAGVCDVCGGALYQRPDDNEKTVANRFAVYEDNTRPLIDLYKARGIYRAVNGMGAIETVFSDIKAALKEHK